MPMLNFDRFRYLNGSGADTTDVEYSAHGDKEAEPTFEIYAATPVSAALNTGKFVDGLTPGGAPVPGVRSIRVKRIALAGQPPAKMLTNWILTSSFEEADEINCVQVHVAPASGAAGPPYRATAQIYFADNTYEERTRFFG